MKKVLLLSLVALAATGTARAHDDEAKPKQALVHEQKRPIETAQADTKPTAHSGGTDANGCHTNHATGEYHCHNPRR